MTKVLSIAGIAAAAMLLALLPALVTIYGEAYPADPDKQIALKACAREQPAFNRFLRAQRAHCYARLQPLPAAPPLVPRRVQVAQLAP